MAQKSRRELMMANNGGAIGTVIGPDVTAPTISAPVVTDNGDGTFTFTWTTNEASTSRIEFGPDATPDAYAFYQEDATLVTSHSITLTAADGLTESAAYDWRMVSADALGNTRYGTTGASTAGTITVPSSYDAASSLIFAAFTTPPSSARKTAIDTLVRALKAASVWTEIDRLYVLAAADSQAARIDWKNPGTDTLTAANTPTFVADRGYTGNGSNMSLDGGTNYSALTKYTQNSAHWAVWGVNNTTDAAYCFGQSADTHNIGLRLSNGGANSWHVNSGAIDSVAVADTRGLFLACRSGANASELFRNGVSIDTNADASAARPAGVITILRNLTSFSASHQLAFVSVGADITSAQVAFYNAVRAYMTAVGVP